LNDGFFIFEVFINKLNIMSRIIKLTERDLIRIVKRVINEQDSTTTTTGSAKPSPGQTTKPGVPGQSPEPAKGIKTVKPTITIDCDKRLVTNSNLPKLPDNTSNLAMNTGLINYYCQAGK
jgi:hypothetical protein